jgi:hypothetical protein
MGAIISQYTEKGIVLYFGNLLHFFTSDGIARIPSMHYNGAGDWLKPIECILDNALIMSVFVLSELATCSIFQPNNRLHFSVRIED